ncbi:MAG TPA: hypothetical protein VM370_02705 [Candidatus Thermoplasmatota archaeon]|nr:hypothetical protein [Candidatus Thermoplasmatota archaeon]
MMRELATKEYTPPLAYAAAILFLAQFATAVLLDEQAAAFGVHLLFVPVLVLLVMRVDAPAWARLAGYGWAGLSLVADITALGSAMAGTSLAAGQVLFSLALVPGAVWIYGASLMEEGASRALGAAAAAGLVFSAILGITRRLVLVGAWDLGAVLQQLALVLAIVWFAVLAKDLSAGKRHWGGPVRVVA